MADALRALLTAKCREAVKDFDAQYEPKNIDATILRVLGAP